MATRLKGKWAQGIQPRNFSWVIKDKLAICERPGGYAANHRRVRRQEEIIWIREQGFGCVISLIPTPHNLHNYDELGVKYLHRPFSPVDDPREVLGALYPELRGLLVAGTKVIMHIEEVSDRLAGVVAQGGERRQFRAAHGAAAAGGRLCAPGLRHAQCALLLLCHRPGAQAQHRTCTHRVPGALRHG